jgi:hypothetical protein
VPGGGGASGVAGAPGLAGYALFATVGGGSRAGVPTGGDPPHRGISGADRDTATGGVWAGSAGAAGGVSTIGGEQLVAALATCPEGETAQVLAAHPDLQDVGLVLCLGQEAGKLQVLGQGAIAARLLRLGQELGAKLGLSNSPEPEAPTRSLFERLPKWVGKKPKKQEAVDSNRPPSQRCPTWCCGCYS